MNQRLQAASCRNTYIRPGMPAPCFEFQEHRPHIGQFKGENILRRLMVRFTSNINEFKSHPKGNLNIGISATSSHAPTESPAPFLSFSLKLLYHTSQPTLSSTCSTLLAHASSPLYHILHCALLEVLETLHLLYVSSLQPHSSSRMPFVHTHGFRLAAFSSVKLHLSRLPSTRSMLSLLRERRQSSANITVH